MSYEPDSRVADRAVSSRGYAGGHYAARQYPPAAVVVHTTGAGPVKRYVDERQRARHGWESPFDAALWVYQSVIDAGPHYVLGQRGECVQVAPEGVCAWHVGSAESHPYTRAPRESTWAKSEATWWFERWGPRLNPCQLAGDALWFGGSCNANTLGIEVVPPGQATRGPWSTDAWRTLAILVEDICERHEIPVERDRILTHSDAHPRARTARGAPWDPPPAQWTWGRYCEWTSRDPVTGAVLPR